MGDIMLLGVLRMPFDDHGDIHLIQLRQRCLTAAKRIEDDTEKIAALEAERDRLREALVEIADYPNQPKHCIYVDYSCRLLEIARKALEEE